VIDRELIDCGRNLKFIARAGAGLDQIDIDYTTKKAIEIINAPEGNKDAVGEHAIGMLLALFNHMVRADRQVRVKNWQREQNRGIELHGKTVGLVGYGNMGQAFAKRLSGFDCEVIAYDKYKKGFSDNFAREVTLGELYEKTQILSFHIPLNSETRHLANEEYFRNFNQNIYLINTARGEIIPLKTLLNQLLSGKIRGAALDVLEVEKFQNLSDEQNLILNELFKLDNVIFTPHVAGWSEESYIKINQTLAKKIKLLKLA